MTPRSHRAGGRLLRRLGLVFGLILCCCLVTSGLAGAAQGDLTLAISSPDLSAYPTGLVRAATWRRIRARRGPLQELSGSKSTARPSPVDSLKAAGAGVAAPVQTVLLIDESRQHEGRGDCSGLGGGLHVHRRHAARRIPPRWRPLTSISGRCRLSERHGALKASLDCLDPTKETALYDALVKALASFPPASHGSARYVILVSDGGDTTSTATLDQALAAVSSSGIPVYVVGLKSLSSIRASASLAEVSGSRYLETPDPGR